MRILVTNDDGVYAKGIWALAESLSEAGEVTIVAPDREQSGVGSSITMHHPVRITEVRSQVNGIKTYAVEGTPSDSVIVALNHLLDGDVDLVVSGINEGANLGNDVFVSGTVGAAFQGYFRGIPSFAISITALKELQLDVASRLAALLAVKLAEGALPRDLLLNINLPNLPMEEIKGIEITRLGRKSYTETIREGEDGKRKYYWIVRGKPAGEAFEGTDIWAVRNQRISITPLHTDITSHKGMALLGGVASDLLKVLQP